VRDVGLTRGYVPPANPPANLAPVPDYTWSPGKLYSAGDLPVCWLTFSVSQPGAPACVAGELEATDRAQGNEHLPPIVLPRDYSRLTVPEQLLVLTDIERVSRGEPAVLGLSARADVYAQQGAAHNADPVVPQAGSGIPGSTGASGSNWAGAISPLDANYGWMYADGWEGKLTFNYACTSADAPGCWGHRDNILSDGARMPCPFSSCTLVMGAGYEKNGYSKLYNSYTEVFIQISSSTPPLFYTWSEAVAEGARA
jgi:hypothetical protein